jgi:predicted dehydrogenase
MIGIGIVGLGMALSPHMHALRDLEAAGRARMIGGFSPSAVRRDAFALRWKAPVFDRLESLLAAPGCDMVIVLTPPGAHLPVVEAAAAARKHILVEKPLEITLARAETLVATAERAGVTLGVVFQHRFRPAALRLKQAVAAGELGTLLSCSASIRWWRDAAYFAQAGRGMKARDGGGVLLTTPRTSPLPRCGSRAARSACSMPPQSPSPASPSASRSPAPAAARRWSRSGSTSM